MPTSLNESSDFDKLLKAFSAFSSISSIDDLLGLFGLSDLPTAQKYGILGGCIVFTITVGTVFTLLLMGGSFQRIVEQAETGEKTVPSSVDERMKRPLLLERLLEAQERLQKNYPNEERTEEMSNLTKMLLNVAPDISKAKEVTDTIQDDGSELNAKEKVELAKKKEELKKFLPDGYAENYVVGYRKCQDKPGGPTISGLPEARFEAYARAYAGCGKHVPQSYSYSYARLYESVSCQNHKTESQYRKHWLERPGDLVGRTIRLEPLTIERHLQELYDVTCGLAYKEHRAFDANEIWCFVPEGPFDNVEDMRQSFLFQRKKNEAAFAIVEFVTGKLIGVVLLTNDNPQNLTISLEIPIVKPSSDGTVESIEACFLLIDRLFAIGYRRIQLSIDSMDINGKKLPGRLGFTQEGLLLKDRVVKEANRDSLIYALLNSDWDKGARAFLYKKLHGEKAMKVDMANTKKEEELLVQQKYLAEQKAAQALAKAKLL